MPRVRLSQQESVPRMSECNMDVMDRTPFLPLGKIERLES
jgi:hypothetical protein